MKIEKILSWMFIHSISILFILLFYYILEIPIYLLYLTGVGSILYFVYQNVKIHGFGLILQWANLTTLLRVFLIFLFGYFAYKIDVFSSGIVASFIFGLDGLDGYLARKFKTESTFGQYFDMETDAFFILVLCLFISSCFPEFSLIWFVGILRYIYFIINYPFRNLKRSEEKNWWARYAAGLFMIASTSIMLIDMPFVRWIVFISSLLIILSFLLSFYNLYTSILNKK